MCASTSSSYDPAHRAAYALDVGPIPEGLTIDHLCRVRHCVRPDHLEPVTQAENTRRAALANKSTGLVRVDGPTWDAAKARAEAEDLVLSEEIRRFLERWGKAYRKEGK